MLLPEKMGSLIVHLARGGRVDEAFILAQRLLSPMAQTEEAYDAWRFEQLLNTITPALVLAGGLRALDLLGDMLSQAIDDEAGSDTSFVWRPAIEDHEQNGPVAYRASRQILITALRDATTQLITHPMASVEDVIASL